MNNTDNGMTLMLRKMTFFLELPVWGQRMDGVHKPKTEGKRDGQDGTDWTKNRKKYLIDFINTQ